MSGHLRCALHDSLWQLLVAFGSAVVVRALDDDKSRRKIHPHRQRGSGHQHGKTAAEKRSVDHFQEPRAIVHDILDGAHLTQTGSGLNSPCVWGVD